MAGAISCTRGWSTSPRSLDSRSRQSSSPGWPMRPRLSGRKEPMSEAASEMDLSRRIASIGIVPVVQLPRPELAVPLAETLGDAGIPCLEVTFRAESAAQAIAAIRAARPEVLVGAGTVLTIEQADAAIEAGAEFIVSPGTNSRVVPRVLGRGA